MQKLIRKEISRKPIFWLLLSLLFSGGAIFSYLNYSKVFPIVTLDLKMDRGAALQSARSLAKKHNLGPGDFEQAATFDLDYEAKTYVELEAGGSEAFQKMLEDGLYAPYTWTVRHFKEGEVKETLIHFTPSGKPYGFAEWLEAGEHIVSLSQEKAITVAETEARDTWHVDLAAYELVEKSHEVRSKGRVDHTFVYERLDHRIGEAGYRLRLEVSGDKLTELRHFIKIPESFSLRYKEMRSANNTIADLGSFVMDALYGLIGCVIGLLFLLRKRWVIWRTPLFWGIAVASLQALATVNQWPLAWMDYDTALSVEGFVLQNIVDLLQDFLWDTAFLTLSFMAAESLSRKAFPRHLQLWRLSSPGVANSTSVLGQTVGGYLLVGLDLAFLIALYFFSTKVLGWWTPSDTLIDPDVLATYFPWLTPIARSLQAGFWEECLCRAVPIAGAALIGERFGRRRAWVFGALILQAFIFGALHANYSAQPAYARVVELIIPSLVYGGIYLRFGLLPAIIAHFAYDVVLFALPLFASSAPGIWVDQALLVTLALIPLWVVLYQRWSCGKWGEPEEKHFNGAWQPVTDEHNEPLVQVVETPTIGPKTLRWVLLGGLVGLVLWGLGTDFQNNAPPLSIGRGEAEALARQTLIHRGVTLTGSWQALGCVRTPIGKDDRFIWQECGKDTYKELMGKYLSPPQWKVRFARFDGDLTDRAEEYRVYITGDGKVFRVWHLLPETRVGASLSRGEARALADLVLRAKYRLDPASLKEVSADSAKLPARRDWNFTFVDPQPYPLNGGEARIEIEIAGNEVVDAYRYVRVPGGWFSAERFRNNVIEIAEGFMGSIRLALIMGGIAAAAVGWSRKRFSVPVFGIFFAILLGHDLISMLNNWVDIKAGFSSAEPVLNQAMTEITSSLSISVLVSGALALLAGFEQSWKRPEAEIQFSWALFLGVALGCVIAGLSSFLTSLGPSLVPTLADYGAASSYFPIPEAALSPVEHYVKATILLLLVFTVVDKLSKGGAEWKPVFTAGLILCGFKLTSTTPENNIFSVWLLEAVLIGTLLLLAYRHVFRFHLATIPLVVATVSILGLIREIVFNAYPAAIPGAVLGIPLISILSYYWFRTLRESQNQPVILAGQVVIRKRFNLLSVREQD